MAVISDIWFGTDGLWPLWWVVAMGNRRQSSSGCGFRSRRAKRKYFGPKAVCQDPEVTEERAEVVEDVPENASATKLSAVPDWLAEDDSDSSA